MSQTLACLVRGCEEPMAEGYYCAEHQPPQCTVKGCDNKVETLTDWWCKEHEI